MGKLLNYNGSDKVKKRIADVLNVTDVWVNGVSVVNGSGVAHVPVPTSTSDLDNDSGFVTNTVNNLVNYYTKTNTYSKQEVDSLIGSITTISFEVVQTLPTTNIKTNVIYLLPKSTAETNNIYDEYINPTGTTSGWEKIGETTVDLSNYYTKTETDNLLDSKANTADLATKYDSSDATETTLADDDKVPFYDTSASGRRNSTWANIKAKLKSYFDGIYSTFSGNYSDLSNKPTLGTASAKDVPASGNASTTQVVMGNDSRLSDSRPASDVPAWAKASTKPTYTASEVGLGNVPNVATNDQTPTFTQASSRANIASGEKLSVSLGKIMKWFADLKAVAFSGSYNDLSDTPATPTVNNGTLTIQKNGTNVQTFTANQSGDVTANILVAANDSLTNQNLNNVKTPGFYNAGGGNTVTNKPSGVDAFGLEVIHSASGNYYVQIIYPNVTSIPYRRYCSNGTWSSWVRDVLTDTTYSSKSAVPSGTDVSLVTTGEKATWNAKSNFSGSYNDLSDQPSIPTKVSELTNDSGYTTNTGTITEIKMNGASKGTSGVVDLGTVLTEHQNISGKANKQKTIDTYYGTCSTAAGTAAKVITVTDNDSNFTLRAGVSILVKFTNTNTAQNPTFNVNGKGAKSVWFNTALITTGNLGYAGTANRPMQFVYDGTQWIFVSWSYDANTTYSAMSTSELTTGTATTSRTVRADYLKAGIESIAESSAIDTADNKATFTQASERANISSGESHATIFGKIMKYLADLGAAAYKAVVTSVDASASLPTSNAVKTFVEGKGYVTANNRKAFFGTCDTAAGTAAKVVTLADTDGWELKAGTVIGVKYTNTNSASNVTLNVNGSGAKSIWHDRAVYTGSSSGVCGYASKILYYMYDGTYWVFHGSSADSNNAVTQTATSTNANYEVLFSATADNTTRTEGARKYSNFKFNPHTGNLQTTQLNGVTIGSSPKFTDTHRPIKVNGTEMLGDDTTALDLIAGSNVSINNSRGTVVISSTDTIPNWAQAGSTFTGAVSCDLSTYIGSKTLVEVYIVTNVNNSTTPVNCMTFIPGVIAAATNAGTFRSGYTQLVGSTNQYGVASFKVTGKVITLDYATINGTDKTSTATWRVFYKAY